MGDSVECSCSHCGYNKVVLTGGGMADYSTRDAVPVECPVCKDITTANALTSPLSCLDCGSAAVRPIEVRYPRVSIQFPDTFCLVIEMRADLVDTPENRERLAQAVVAAAKGLEAATTEIASPNRLSEIVAEQSLLFEAQEELYRSQFRGTNATEVRADQSGDDDLPKEVCPKCGQRTLLFSPGGIMWD